MKEYHEEMAKEAKMIVESDMRYEQIYYTLEKWHIKGEKSWADKDRPNSNQST